MSTKSDKNKGTVKKLGGFTYVDGKFTRVGSLPDMSFTHTLGYASERNAVREELRFLNAYTCEHAN